MKVLGIDPGGISGWAIVQAEGDAVIVHSWGGARSHDDRAYAITHAAGLGVDAIYIENSGNFGFVRTTLSLADKRARWDELCQLFLKSSPDPVLVMPQVWQRRLGYNKHGTMSTKDFAKSCAADAIGGFTSSEHAADAACIALFGLLDQQHPKQKVAKKATKRKKGGSKK